MATQNAQPGNYGLLSAPRDGYITPISSIYGTHITSDFGPRSAPQTPLGIGSSNHKGMDMRGPDAKGQVGYAVNAVNSGIVTAAAPRGGLGLAVTIMHDDGMKSVYGHLNSLSVAKGDRVAQGVPIGTLGNTGRSSGPHLHFELMDPQGRQVDPKSYMDFVAQQAIPTPTFADRSQPAQGQVAAAFAVDPAAAYAQMADTMSQAGILGMDGRASTGGLLADQANVYGQMAQSMGQAGLLGLDGRSQVGVATSPAQVAAMEAALSKSDPAFSTATTSQGVPTQSVQSVAITPGSPALGTSIAPAGTAASNVAAAPVGSVQQASLPTTSMQQGLVSTTPGTTAAAPPSQAAAQASQAAAQAVSMPGSQPASAMPANLSTAGLSGVGQGTAMNALGNPMGTPAMMAADQAIADSKAAQASIYGQMAQTMTQAGLLGLDGRPTSQMVATQPVTPVATLAPALPAARDVASRTVAAVPSSVPSQPAAQSFPSAPSMPTGLDAIQGVFDGTVAQAGSKSHPGVTFTAMGNGQVAKSDAYGNVTYSSAAAGPAGAGLSGNFGALSGVGSSMGGLLGGLGQGIGQGLGGLNAASIGRGAIGMGAGMAGSMLGSTLGPVGSIVGGLLGRGLANHLTQNMGRPTMTVTGTGMGAFPSAPAAPPGYMGDSYTTQSYGDMASISPAAAAAISAGTNGGLY